MAASSISKAPCATCDCKAIGVFKCEGCGQVFCRKHVGEHREILNHQLDEIVIEFDGLQQFVAENNDRVRQQHILIAEVNKWEQDSIEKIRQTANEARQQLNALIESSTGKHHEEYSLFSTLMLFFFRTTPQKFTRTSATTSQSA